MRYDDGDVETLDLEKETFRVSDGAGDGDGGKRGVPPAKRTNIYHFFKATNNSTPTTTTKPSDKTTVLAKS